MESIKGRLSRVEKAIGAMLAPRRPRLAEAHALMVFAVVLRSPEAAAKLAAYAQGGCTRITAPEGGIAFDWSDLVARPAQE